MLIELGNSSLVISQFHSFDNTYFRFFHTPIALILPEEHFVHSSTKASEAWCLVTTWKGLMPSTAALVYASAVRARTWRKIIAHPSYMVGMLNWSRWWVFHYSLLMMLTSDGNIHRPSLSIHPDSNDRRSPLVALRTYTRLHWSRWWVWQIHVFDLLLTIFDSGRCNPSWSFPLADWGSLPTLVGFQLFSHLTAPILLLIPISSGSCPLNLSQYLHLHTPSIRDPLCFLFSIFLTSSLQADNAGWTSLCTSALSLASIYVLILLNTLHIVSSIFGLLENLTLTFFVSSPHTQCNCSNMWPSWVFLYHCVHPFTVHHDPY